MIIHLVLELHLVLEIHRNTCCILHRNTSCIRIWSIRMTKTIHKKRIKTESMVTNIWGSILQINEQCCLWQNNGKREKQSWRKTDKQQKSLFEMDIKTKLHITKYLAIVW